ncbi:MAG: hypothetical protein LBC40_07740 [Dysgonamonadaceae bacterium]|nr:hypothetical protein [Dysgonamonadaceae bacterium]
MKRFIFLCSTLLLAAVLTAQEEQSPTRQRTTVEERAKRTTEWMTKSLNLTPEQIPPVDSINLLYTKTQHVLLKSAEGNREKVRESLSALETKKQEALSVFLTADQMKTYKEQINERQNRFRNREGNRQRPARVPQEPNNQP